jgi:hypothetical protein
VQVTAVRVLAWTVLDARELQLKLQRRLPRPNLADYQWHVNSPVVDKHPGNPPSDLAVTAALVLRHCFWTGGAIHLRHSQDRNALPGGDSVVSIASVMACSRDNWCRECDRYRTWTHHQVAVGNFRRRTPTMNAY